jgi:hypothetical protein
MNRLRFIPFLLVAVSACGSSTTPVDGPVVVEEQDFQVVGTVATRSLLIGTDGRRYVLVGPQAAWLQDLVGAEIRLRGEPDVNGSIVLWIIEFRILTVDGLAAVDGTLRIPPDGGYAIHSSDGVITPIPEIPGALTAHVGKRVWLTMKDGKYVRFGAFTD